MAPPSSSRCWPWLLTLTALALLALAVAAWQLSRPAHAPVRASLAVADALGGKAEEGYARAEAPIPFQFPADHGPHPDFRSEWWYFTGNLASTTDPERRFGFHFTLFRTALAPPVSGMDQVPERTSPFASRQLYMGHFALADVETEQFHAFERFSRGALGLAGAEAEPFQVWLQDWRMESVESEAGQGEDIWPVRLYVAEEGEDGRIELDLHVTAVKPRVLQGVDGWSRKGAEPGNASYYYSYTRLRAEGRVEMASATYEVQGSSWLDREWSTSALGEGQVGWDWFALQYEAADGAPRELMVYQIRLDDGSADPLSKGLLVEPDGASRVLAREDFELEVLETWTSDDGAATYPVSWRVRVPFDELELTVVPRLRDQELLVSVRYWEGAVRVEGERRGEAVSGQGYLEMTGYTE